MPKVAGLTPTQDRVTGAGRLKGRVQTPVSAAPQVNLRPQAAPVDTYVRPQVPTVDQNIQQLSRVLAQLNPAIGSIAQQNIHDMTAEQRSKLPWYLEQMRKFKEDHQLGSVSKAQVKDVFPELVPTVAATVSQAMGSVDAKQWVQDKVQAVLENDALRLNTPAREAYLQKVRQEARQAVGDNPYYGSGFFSQIDKSLAEFNTSWMRETAAYHEKVQAEYFSGQISDILKSGGDGLIALDGVRKKASSLNDRQFNDLVVSTAVNQAVSSNNVAVLNNIPTRFLNAQSKAVIQKAKYSIENAMFSQYTHNKRLEQDQRDQQLRQGKIGVLERVANGEVVSPTEFFNNPDLHDYVARLNQMPTVNPAESAHSSESMRSNLLRAGTTGSFMDAFSNDPRFQQMFGGDSEVTQQKLSDYILNSPNMNANDKVKLMGELPVLMDGVNFLRNPDFSAAFTAGVGNDMKALSSSFQTQILQKMGVNIQGSVRHTFDERLRQETLAYIEDHGRLPHGKAKLEIIDSATKSAQDKLVYYQTHYKDVLTQKAKEMTTQGGGASSTVTLPNGVTARKIE